MELKMFNDGFYTAAGTPLDADGNVIKSSFDRHIEQQISCGAAGLLIMGSMGIQSAVKDGEYPKVAKYAAEAVRGRIPVLVGAMDNSVCRVAERIKSLDGVEIDGVVLTTPYYYLSVSDDDFLRFFNFAADLSHVPIYLYDLPSVTKQHITYEVAKELSKHKNIKGIKTGDMILARKLKLGVPDFEVMYSGIDTFDVSVAFGIRKVLDGMFSCTPHNTALMNKAFLSGKIAEGGRYLDNILSLRDKMREHGVFFSFTAAMNLLGFEGIFSPDYMAGDGRTIKESIYEKMVEIGEM